MTHSARRISDLIAIAQTGAHLDINASAKKNDELVALAEAAREAGGRLMLRNTSNRTMQELMAIATAGRSCVTLAD